VSYPYSAVVDGVLQATSRGSRFDGTVRPGWGTILAEAAFLLLLGGGAIWFAIDAAVGTGDGRSRLERLALSSLFTMMLLALAVTFFQDLRRLTEALEAEFLAAMKL
jgi:hypothetical protein